MQNPYLPGQHADFLNNLIGLQFGTNLEIKKPRMKERSTHMIYKLLYLIGLYRNEALVATVLAIFRLEDDARHTARFPLLGSDVLAGESAWDRVDSLIIFWVGSGESLQVGELWSGV